MSKKNSSEKNTRLSNLAIVIVVLAVILILFNSSIIKTIVTVALALAILRFIWKKIEKYEE